MTRVLAALALVLLAPLFAVLAVLGGVALRGANTLHLLLTRAYQHVSARQPPSDADKRA